MGRDKKVALKRSWKVVNKKINKKLYFVYFVNIYYKLLTEVIKCNINKVKSFLMKKIRNGVLKMNDSNKELNQYLTNQVSYLNSIIKSLETQIKFGDYNKDVILSVTESIKNFKKVH